MHKFLSPRALLRATGEAHLPVLELEISDQFQFCVDAGVSSAAELLAHLPRVALHDHVSLSLSAFRKTVQAGMAASGDQDAELLRACIDAFTAGYLGHLQRHLMQAHGIAGPSASAFEIVGARGHA